MPFVYIFYFPSPLSPGPQGSHSTPGSPAALVSVRSPEYAILGQTVHLYCNFTLPVGHTHFYTLKVLIHCF